MDWGVVFSVTVGGALTLLGTIMANYLQARAEDCKEKKARAKERIAEVRHYLATCLEFADVVSIPTTIGKDFDSEDFKEWGNIVNKTLHK